MDEFKKFSALERKNNIKEMSGIEYDLLVVGGGITGAGIALDAVTRGLSVALVEKQDFGAGTSSRSTKLVHGGLRYLEHLELGLVHEVGREREIVHKNAGHIVLPEKMLLPIIKGGSLGEFTTSIALYVYDHLAGVKKSEHRRMLSLEQTLEKEPLLKSDLLEGGAIYYEYKTDDSRLTIEVLKKAIEHGAVALNYAEVTEFVYQKDKICGAQIKDQLGDKNFTIKAKEVVNATGAWVDQMRKKDNSLKGKSLQLTKGIHIVVSKEKFNLQHAIYFDVGDNRMVFAIPRFNVVYIGTTDTTYEGQLEEPGVTRKDVQYLIDAVNRIAPTVKFTIEDVESAWSGLRPLIHEDGKAPSELSRKDEIFYGDSGLLSIAGGKLTGYRIMAKKVVDIVTKRILQEETERKFKKCKTKNIKLAGGDFSFPPEAHYLEEYNEAKFDEAKQTGILAEDFRMLFYRYGTNMDMITEKAYEFFKDGRDSKKAWTKAEVWYCVNYEMTFTLADFFVRRTGKIHFFIQQIAEELPLVKSYMAELLKWTAEQEACFTDELDQKIKLATVFE